MGRVIGLLLAATLSASASAYAQAWLPPAPSLGGLLIARIFGEIPLPRSLVLRDASDESPLHTAAFRVSFATLPQMQPQTHPVTRTPAALVAYAKIPQLPSSRDGAGRTITRTASRQTAPVPVTAEYQPETIVPTASASGAFSFPIGQDSAPLGFSTQETDFGEFSALASGSAQLPLSMRVGNVRLQARFGAASQLAPASAESGEILPAFIAPYTSVNRNVLGAAFALPVAPRLLLGFGYDTEHVLGGYQMPGYDSLDARNDTYSGKLTFLIPRFSSSLSLSAEQYRYQDNLLQSDAYTQLRESLNLTVKF